MRKIVISIYVNEMTDFSHFYESHWYINGLVRKHMGVNEKVSCITFDTKIKVREQCSSKEGC